MGTSVEEGCSSTERAYSTASSNPMACPSANAASHSSPLSCEQVAARYGSRSAAYSLAERWFLTSSFNDRAAPNSLTARSASPSADATHANPSSDSGRSSMRPTSLVRDAPFVPDFPAEHEALLVKVYGSFGVAPRGHH